MCLSITKLSFLEILFVVYKIDLIENRANIHNNLDKNHESYVMNIFWTQTEAGSGINQRKAVVENLDHCLGQHIQLVYRQQLP